ncbi:MAG: hypothetical protein ABFD79_18780, partial [Phycisphaerales bacterium]
MSNFNLIAEEWFSWQVSMLWQVGVLIILVACADFILRKWAWPQVRYALWLLILVKLVLPPALTSPASFTAEIPIVVQQTLTNTAYNTDLHGLEIQNAEDRTQNLEEIENPKSKILPSGKSELSKYEVQNGKEIALPRARNDISSPATGAGAKHSLVWKVYLMGAWVIGVFVLWVWVI